MYMGTGTASFSLSLFCGDLVGGWCNSLGAGEPSPPLVVAGSAGCWLAWIYPGWSRRGHWGAATILGAGLESTGHSGGCGPGCLERSWRDQEVWTCPSGVGEWPLCPLKYAPLGHTANRGQGVLGLLGVKQPSVPVVVMPVGVGGWGVGGWLQRSHNFL